MGIVGFWWRRETGLTSARRIRQAAAASRLNAVGKGNKRGTDTKPDRTKLKNDYVMQIARWQVFGGKVPGIPKRLRAEIEVLIGDCGGPASWAAKQPGYEAALLRFSLKKAKTFEG